MITRFLDLGVEERGLEKKEPESRDVSLFFGFTATLSV